MNGDRVFIEELARKLKALGLSDDEVVAEIVAHFGYDEDEVRRHLRFWGIMLRH